MTNPQHGSRRAGGSHLLKAGSSKDDVSPTTGLEIKFGGRANHLPTPPRSYGKQLGRAAPMTVGEALQVLAAYNRWADLWNQHERDRALPLNPGSSEGAFYLWRRPTALAWQPRGSSLTCILRIESWEPAVPDHLLAPYIRQVADPDKIVWAGWIECGRGWS